MSFLRRVVAVSLVAALAAVASETERRRTGDLGVKRAESFCIEEGRYWQFLTEEAIYEFGQKDMEYVYERYSKEHNIDVATLHGDNFKPREFWTQPSRDIFGILFPLLKRNKVFDVVNPEEEMVCFPTHNLGYDFVDEMSKEFPEVIEYLLERDVLYEINGWMKKHHLKGIDWYEYQESLHNYYGAKKPLEINDPKARRLPLYEYFLPYLEH